MADNVLDCVGPEGIVQGHRDQVEKVAAHLGDVPLGPAQGPDAERPPVQLWALQDDLVEVHQSTAKGVDPLVDLGICLPGVAAVCLGHGVVRTMAEELAVSVLCYSYDVVMQRRFDREINSTSLATVGPKLLHVVAFLLTVLEEVVKGLDVRSFSNVLH